MILESSDIALMIYIAFMVFALFISYIFASKMIRKTGLFGSQVFIASAIDFCLDICAIIGWFFFSWGVNEFVFLGGLMLGAGMLVVSQAILLTVLFVRKRQMLQAYNDNINNNYGKINH